jgi:hypothetical protein
MAGAACRAILTGEFARGDHLTGQPPCRICDNITFATKIMFPAVTLDTASHPLFQSSRAAGPEMLAG